MNLRPAKRASAKLRINLSAPSGAGKTLGALLIARGLTDSWEEVAVIDTENGSADLYADKGKYGVLTLQNFTPESYIEAIKVCEEAGAKVIIVDSISHEWETILNLVEPVAQARFRGNTYGAWAELTPRHQALLNAIVRSPAHVITTSRNKTDTVLEGGKVKKVGIKDIQREGYEYEFTVNLLIDKDTHLTTSSKDRTRLFEGKDPFTITEKTGKLLRKWSEQGEDIVGEIELLASELGADLAKTVSYFGVDRLSDMSLTDQLKVLEQLKKKKGGTNE